MSQEEISGGITENKPEKFFTKPLIVIFITMFIDLIGFGVAIPVLPDYAKSQFGASPFTIGWLIAMYSIMQFVSTPFLGQLSDKYGRRPILLVSLLGTSVAALITGLATTLPLLFFGRIFDGITGGNISTAQAYIADVTSKENRAKGMGLIGAAFGLGFVFGPAIGGILSKVSPHAPFFFVSALAFANATLLYFILPESIKKGAVVTAEFRKHRLAELMDSLKNAQFGTLTAIYFFLVTAFSIMNFAFVLYTKERFAYAPEQNGYIFAFIGVIAVIFQGGLVGRLADRFGENLLTVTGCLVMAAGLFSLPFIFPQAGGLGALLVVMAVMAMGNSMASTAVTSLVSKNSHDHEQGKSLGVLQSGASLARAIGPALGGVLLDNAINQVDDFTVKRTFWTASAVMLVAMLIAFFSRRLHREKSIDE
ncbi:MAG: MFS transporter [Acidobacteria bacterium]|nr:MFS transporter [Acidobacteriota bacterium]